MSLYQQFKTDSEKEQNGVLVTYGPNNDGSIPGFRLLRRNSTNQRYAKTLERETQQYRRLIELGTLDNKISERVFMRVFCIAVLIGWENVQDKAGKNIVFTLENAMNLFQELPDLYDDLVTQSGKVSLFRESLVEADVKN